MKFLLLREFSQNFHFKIFRRRVSFVSIFEAQQSSLIKKMEDFVYYLDDYWIRYKNPTIYLTQSLCSPYVFSGYIALKEKGKEFQFSHRNIIDDKVSILLQRTSNYKQKKPKIQTIQTRQSLAEFLLYNMDLSSLLNQVQSLNISKIFFLLHNISNFERFSLEIEILLIFLELFTPRISKTVLVLVKYKLL